MFSNVLPTRVLHRLPNKTLVNRLARFNFEGTCPVSILSITTDMRTAWYQIELFVFFNVDSGRGVLKMTDWLSPSTKDGPGTGTPIICNL